jgi:hypothetical protein
MKEVRFKKQVIYVFLAIAVFAFVLIGCKKDDDAGSGVYRMKFKVDGNQVEFNLQTALVAAFGQSGSQYNSVISGSDSKSNVGLQVFDNKIIATGKYSGYTISNSAVVGALMHYQDLNGTVYTQGTVSPDIEITINEINDTTVKGTFRGTLKSTGKANISITDGEFFVWRAN